MSEENDDQTVRFISNRITQTSPFDVMPGSQIERCDICKLQIWISPSTQNARAGLPKDKIVQTICINCYEPPAKDPEVMITAEQITEMEKHLGYKLTQEDLDRSMARFKGLMKIRDAARKAENERKQHDLN